METKVIRFEVKFTRATLALLIGAVLLLIGLVTVGAALAQPPQPGAESPQAGEGEVRVMGALAATDVVSPAIYYQGQLTDAGGSPLDGAYDFAFRIYDAESGGNLLWGAHSVYNVDVDQGLFNIRLPVDAAVFNGQDLWLAVMAREAGGTWGAYMAPRQEILPVPYALSLRPGAIISGSVGTTAPYYGAALAILNEAGRGINVEAWGLGFAGRFIQDGTTDALRAESRLGSGIDATGGSGSNDYGGEFWGWGGVHAFGSQWGVVVDGAGDGDDGRIASNPGDTNSDLVFYTNDEFHVHLDENDDEAGTFTVYNGANAQVFRVDENANWWGDVAGGGSDVTIRTNDDVEVYIGGTAGGDAGIFRVRDRNGNVQFYVTETGNVWAAGNADLDQGTKSAVVLTENYNKRKLYTIESPEVWFEDFGTGQLENGTAVVEIEPIFLETINTDEPYHVFVTPLGNCNGLYVTNKTATSFEVRELGGGTSNVEFDYRIVAKRLGYEDLRLEPPEIATEGEEPAQPASPPDMEDEPIPGEHLTPIAIEPEQDGAEAD